MTITSLPTRPISVGIWVPLAVLAFGIATPAKAEPARDARPLNGATATSDKKGSDHWTIGVGVGAVPLFQGSKKYEAQPLPLIDVQYGRFFAKTGQGIGVNLIETPSLTAGASVNWVQGYDGEDVAKGINDVDDAFGARLFVSARLKGVITTLAATQAVSDTDRGLLINANVSYPVHATKKLAIIPSIGVSWGNQKYMDGYFGVNSSESAASGLSYYEPTNGFKDVSFRITAKYRITDSISAMGSVGVTHLLGKAADSPIVEQQTQPLALVGLTYTF